MKKSMLILSALVACAMADATISAKGNVIYSIDGADSTATSAKEGSVIEYKSGDGKLSIKDSVTNKSMALRKVGDKYEVAKEGSSLGSLETYFAQAQVESKGAFTRGDGSYYNCNSTNYDNYCLGEIHHNDKDAINAFKENVL